MNIILSLAFFNQEEFNSGKFLFQSQEGRMADIAALVEATKRMKERSASHVGWGLAAIRAIEATGIKHKPDVDRLKDEVMAELRRDGTIRPRRRR